MHGPPLLLCTNHHCCSAARALAPCADTSSVCTHLNDQQRLYMSCVVVCAQCALLYEDLDRTGLISARVTTRRLLHTVPQSSMLVLVRSTDMSVCEDKNSQAPIKARRMCTRKTIKLTTFCTTLTIAHGWLQIKPHCHMVRIRWMVARTGARVPASTPLHAQLQRSRAWGGMHTPSF